MAKYMTVKTCDEDCPLVGLIISVRWNVPSKKI